jgi:hypothetical protein
MHKDIAKKIITAFAEKLFSEDRDAEDEIDHRARHEFLEKLAKFKSASK